VQENQVGLKLNGTQQLSAYADDETQKLWLMLERKLV
jgi:hypothetical protein